MLNRENVIALFQFLKTDSAKFFEKVSEDVDWTVMGTHPLAGHYIGKENFLNHTFRRLNKILKGGVILDIRNVYVDGEHAIVEMRSLSTALNEKPFNNVYCWVVRFEGDMIVEVRAYLDSALVTQLLAENEPH